MLLEKTLFVIKPPPPGTTPGAWRTMVEAVLLRWIGRPEILAEREVTLTEAQVRDLYRDALPRLEARDPAYAGRMIAYMTGGPSRLYVLRLREATVAVKTAAGATRSAEARPGSIRRTLGNPEVVYDNVCHAADSEADASRELFALAPDIWAETFR